MTGPMTRAEAEKKRYGAWAGFPNGHAYNPKCCAEEVGFDERGAQHRQCSKPSGHGPDGLYCKQHDPAAQKARDEARDRRYREETERERPKWYAHEMLEIVRKIASGHNDPASLCREFIEKYDAKR